MKPVVAKLTKELLNTREKWLSSGRECQDAIYYREFAPDFVPLFARLPLHGCLDPPDIKALICVLGLSWQPAALMSAWANPDHVMLLGTEESLGKAVDGDGVLDAVINASDLTRDRFSVFRIEGDPELEIYRKVRTFIERHNLKPHEIAVDPTGGKKSMSLSAGLAGFLCGAWILYVDYKSYHDEKRLPLAGTEFPRLLQNPLRVFGDLEFDKIWKSYRNGSFEAAASLAEDLAGKLYEPKEAEALKCMARGYGAWHGFNFAAAIKQLEMLKEYIGRFGRIGRWAWGERFYGVLELQIPILGRLADITKKASSGDKPDSMGEALPLILNHLASAERTLSFHANGAAMLLAYAAMERYVDLALWVHYGLDDQKPDYPRLNLSRRMERFHGIGEKMHGKDQYRPREPAGPVGLALGIQLLAALKPELMPEGRFKGLNAMMQQRNRCEFEHGLGATPLHLNDVEKHIQPIREVFPN